MVHHLNCGTLCPAGGKLVNRSPAKIVCHCLLIQKLGFSAADVRHIVLTHLDIDHAGGLSDFPRAKVHVFDAEFKSAVRPVTLIDHTRGHCGVAVETSAGWLLHAGDAYYYRGEMDLDRPHCSAGLSLFERIMETDRAKRLLNQVRLRDLIRQHGDAIKVFCAHDPDEHEQLASPTFGNAAKQPEA